MSYSSRRPVTLGLAAVALLTLGIFGWGSRASLSGAVIAPGQVQVEARAQVVQHPDGGSVRDIAVRDGDTVTKGARLLSLDGADLISRERILQGQADELQALSARLIAERDGATALTLPEGLATRAAADPAVAAIVAGQESLFGARLTTLRDAQRSYEEQKKQIGNEIEGQGAQVASLATQLDLVEDELGNAQSLLDKGLAEASRVLTLRREAARLTGLKGQTDADIARNLGRIAQIDVEVLRLTAARREEAVTELRDAQSRLAQVEEELSATRTRLSRLDLTAPMDGIVHDLSVHSQGAVIRPAEPVLFIIPQDGNLTVAARIDPLQVDQVFEGQVATLRFSAFNARTTPEIGATVVRLSADTSTDQRTGVQFYTAELSATSDQVALLDGQQLLPGMPVEVFIRTGDRSPLSYIAKPFTDYFSRAFKE
ncbi:MAG: type secretion rane fusion protein [Pseudomonadota bacterium]